MGALIIVCITVILLAIVVHYRQARKKRKRRRGRATDDERLFDDLPSREMQSIRIERKGEIGNGLIKQNIIIGNISKFI